MVLALNVNQPPSILSTLPLLAVILIYYFAVALPQRRSQEKRAYILRQVRPGQWIITKSGLRGQVLETRGEQLIVLSGELTDHIYEFVY